MSLADALRTATVRTVKLKSHPFMVSVHVDDGGAIGVIYRQPMQEEWYADTLGKYSRHETKEAAIQWVIDKNREYLL